MGLRVLTRHLHSFIGEIGGPLGKAHQERPGRRSAILRQRRRWRRRLVSSRRRRWRTIRPHESVAGAAADERNHYPRAKTKKPVWHDANYQSFVSFGQAIGASFPLTCYKILGK